jgi:hypothetical protein
MSKSNKPESWVLVVVARMRDGLDGFVGSTGVVGSTSVVGSTGRTTDADGVAEVHAPRLIASKINIDIIK